MDDLIYNFKFMNLQQSYNITSKIKLISKRKNVGRVNSIHFKRKKNLENLNLIDC